MNDQRANVRTALLPDFFVGCFVSLLAWAIVFGAAISADSSGTRFQLLANAALLTLSSAGTMTSALWLKLKRAEPRREGEAASQAGRTQPLVEGVVELFLLVFVVLGAVSAWSASPRQDAFRAIYLIVLLVALYIVKWPIEWPSNVASVRVVSAWVFGVIAVGHVIRLLAQAPVSIGWWSVPEWISVVAVCAAAILALWNWRDRGGGEARIP